MSQEFLNDVDEFSGDGTFQELGTNENFNEKINESNSSIAHVEDLDSLVQSENYQPNSPLENIVNRSR